jgi:hypothetical protein
MTISPGDTFYDKLDDGRYERCVLVATTDDTPDRHAAARGGTGEFYEALPEGDLPKDMADTPIVFEAGGPFGVNIVFLRRIAKETP